MKTKQQIIQEHASKFDVSLSKDMFRQNLIVGIMDEYAKQIVQSIIDKTYIADDNHNPVITKQELISIKNSI